MSESIGGAVSDPSVPPDVPSTKPPGGAALGPSDPAASVTGNAALPRADSQGMRRMHPLTPVIKGWYVLAVMVVAFGRDNVQSLTLTRLGVVVGIAIPAAALYGYLSWRFTRFCFDGEDIRVETGVLFRRSRRVRLERLQAVDVVRPVLARVFGVAELRLESAGGRGSDARLAYFDERSAAALRAELLARAAGIDASTPEAPERVIAHVPPLRLAVSRLLSLPILLMLVAVLALVGVAVEQGHPAILLGVLPALLGFGQALLQPFFAHFEFTVAESPDGLRLRHGLLETRAQTVPPGRIQAVRLVEPVLWRLVGWARLDVTVAGYAGEKQSETTSSLLPVAPVAEARALIERVLPGHRVAEVELVGVPRSARWLDPLGWRRRAAGHDGAVFVAQRGWAHRELDVVPHARTQSLRLTQGPIQRALGLASLRLDTSRGPVQVTAEHRGVDEARAMIVAQADRARAARASDATERWMIES